MRINSLDLLFLGDPKARFPMGARAYIAVNSYSTIEGHKNVPLLSPDCVTPDEIEHYASALQKELDKLVVKAKKQFADYDRIQSKHLESRRVKS